MTFDDKLARWNARQDGPKQPKPNPRGLFGRKARVPQKQFEEEITREQSERRAEQALELTFPAPK